MSGVRIARETDAASEMPHGEGTPGMGLEIGFEFGGFFSRTECNGCFNLPGPKFRRVWNSTRVMGFKAGLNILRKAGVMA